MTRRLSAITPSGHVQLGNYLGALRHWARNGSADDRYFVSDLHAMTTAYEPAMLRQLTVRTHAIMLASGLPSDRVFVQSDLIAEHASLLWILNCVATFGEARRMTQFKEKAQGRDGVKLGLLTYPVLMAGDILLHGTREVPVGEDQRQHVELARSLARRFNNAHGDVFVEPSATVPTVASRIMDLATPTRKMAKSTTERSGVVFVMDEPELIARKFAKATTDTCNVVRFRPQEQPGVANLLDILGAVTERDPREINLPNYAALKRDTTDAVIEILRPLRERARQLLDDPGELSRLRETAARRARESARPRLAAASRVCGIGTPMR